MGPRHPEAWREPGHVVHHIRPRVITSGQSIKRILNAVRFSAHGIRACLKEEAFRQEVFLSLFFIPFGLWLGDTPAEKALLACSVILVLIVEILNTAIERAIDRISFDRHELSKEAKDMGSAAVMFSLVMAGLIWAVIGMPKFF